MSSIEPGEFIETRLMTILAEMKMQDNFTGYYPSDRLSFTEEMEQIRLYTEHAGEYGLAYELIVINLEEVPFNLSSSSAVKLLEVGLLMNFKTERDEDRFLDNRE